MTPEKVNDMDGDSLESRIMDRNVTTLNTFREGSGNLQPDHDAAQIKAAETKNNYPS